MRSGPAATLGVLLGLALILPACGDERTAAAGGGAATAGTESTTTDGKTTAPGKAMAKAQPAARQCGRLLGDFVDSMESLNNTLAVGLDYEGYLGAVNHVRATYASLPAERLPFVCLTRAGAPAEQALNIYLDTANTWGDCLANTSCNPESVEPKLQRRWEQASDLLSDVQSGLRDLG